MKKRKPAVSGTHWYSGSDTGFKKRPLTDLDVDRMITMLEEMKAKTHGKRR